MTKPLNKGTKARLRRVAQALDKAQDFLHKAMGELYSLPEYRTQLEELANRANQVAVQIEEATKANPPPAEPEQSDIEDFTKAVKRG